MTKTALPSILLVLVHLAVGTIVDAQQSSQTRTDLDPVYDPAYRGTAFSDRGGPFLIQVNASFFRQTASYPRGETLAEGTFVFVDVKIFNNSDRPLRIPYFTLQDSRGRTYPTAIRARRSRNAILVGEPLNSGVAKAGYLIFDVPRISASDSLPFSIQAGGSEFSVQRGLRHDRQARELASVKKRHPVYCQMQLSGLTVGELGAVYQ
jgi:uncharacterized protein DUF4352